MNINYDYSSMSTKRTAKIKAKKKKEESLITKLPKITWLETMKKIEKNDGKN